MGSFRFLIEDTLPALRGVEGAVLAGRQLSPDGKLAVGDLLRIDVPDGSITVRATAFPLIRRGCERRWISIAVAGLPREVEVVGAVATAVGDW